jgi:hypothetical protein
VLIVKAKIAFKSCKTLNHFQIYRGSMGKVSMFLIVIGSIPLLPAVILTIISVVSPSFFADTLWFNSIVRAFIIGFLYIIAFAFIGLGLIVMKRDLE